MNISGELNEFPIDCYQKPVARGESMYPTIKQNQTIFVNTCYPLEFLEVNDIIVFYYNKTDSFMGHRIIKITDEGFITKGDNNKFNDELVRKKQYIGKVVV